MDKAIGRPIYAGSNPASPVNERMNQAMDRQPKTEMTLENRYGTVCVSVNEDDLSIGDVLEKLVVPLLSGAGYPRDLVEAIDVCDSDDTDGRRLQRHPLDDDAGAARRRVCQ